MTNQPPDSGTGAGRTSPTAARSSQDDPIDQYLGVIQKRAKAFYSDAANKIFVIDHGDPQGAELLRSYAASVDSDILALLSHEPALLLGHLQREGLYLMAAALGGPCRAGTYTVVAVHSGHPVAAVRFDHYPGHAIHVQCQGSAQVVPGATTALQHASARFGVETDAPGVSGFLTADLVPYERAIGRVVAWPSDGQATLDEERIADEAANGGAGTSAEDPYYQSALAAQDAWRRLQTETGFDPNDYDPDAIVPRVQAFLFRCWSNNTQQR